MSRKTRVSQRVIALFVCALVWGCSDAEPEETGQVDSGLADAAVTQDVGVDARDVGGDADPSDVGPDVAPDAAADVAPDAAAEVCGDGIVDSDEVCDDGNQQSGDGCSADCQSDETCGNGVVDDQVGEECDAGESNTDDQPDQCRSDCTLPVCGDGVVDPQNGEACDEGAANSDDQPDACRTDCQPARCGDGIVDSGEACDDGNTQPGDGCTPNCALPPGDYVWSATSGGTGDQAISDVVADSAGNVFAAGHFENAVDLGAGSQASTGGTDGFLAAFDSAGTLRWTKFVSSSNDDAIAAMAVMPAGGVAVLGSGRAPIDFGAGPQGTSGQGEVLFLATYDANGNLGWSKIWAASGSNNAPKDFRAVDVAVGSTGDIYFTADFAGAVDLGGGALESAEASSSNPSWSEAALVAKFSSAGAHQWSQSFSHSRELGYSFEETARGLDVDSQGRVSLTGRFWGSIDFGGGALQSAGGEDIFLAQFDSAGTHLFSHGFGTSQIDTVYDIAVDASDAIILVGDAHSSSIDFGDGSSGPAAKTNYIVQFDASGAFRWLTRIDRNNNPYRVATAAGAIWVGGWQIDVPNFSDRLLRPWMAKFDNAGQRLWGGHFNSKKQVTYREENLIQGVALDPSGTPYVGGFFETSTDFGAGEVTHTDAADLFLVGLTP